MDKPVAIFPGTFDPFTIGHLSVLERALPLFGKIVVTVGFNPAKPMAIENVSERIEKIRNIVNNYPDVSVSSYTGLTVDEARKHNATYILRGVRDVSDYEYERRMADVNRKLTGIETLLIFTLPEHSFISSSVVRELEKFGEDITPFLPNQ